MDKTFESLWLLWLFWLTVPWDHYIQLFFYVYIFYLKTLSATDVVVNVKLSQCAFGINKIK